MVPVRTEKEESLVADEGLNSKGQDLLVLLNLTLLASRMDVLGGWWGRLGPRARLPRRRRAFSRPVSPLALCLVISLENKLEINGFF